MMARKRGIQRAASFVLLWALLLVISPFANAHQQTDDTIEKDSGDPTKYFTIKTTHFYIHYPEELATLTKEIKEISETSFSDVTDRLQWKPKGRIHMVISNKSDQSNGFATVAPYNYIFLYVTPPHAGSSLDNYKDYLRLLIQHELTHIVHIDQHHRWATPFRYMLGKVINPNSTSPVWMREGMAVYEESVMDADYGRNNSDYSSMVLRTSHYENRFPKIGQINGSTVHFPGGMGPYLYGGEFFEWLGKTYGEDRMYKYQEEYASGLWLYSVNNKARRVYGKSFNKLWKEFKKAKALEFDLLKADVEGKGLTELEPVLKNRPEHTSLNNYVPRPGSTGYAYSETSFDDGSKFFIYPEADVKKPIKIKRPVVGQMSFSKDGRYLAFSSYSSVEPKARHAEVFLYDLKTEKIGRMYDKAHKTKSMHAMDPDWSPVDDGARWMVMVRQFIDTDQLYIFDAVEKKGYLITEAAKKTQFSNPRFSPDGELIVVSRKAPDGKRDIVVYSKTGKEVLQITNDSKIDNYPVFSRDGKTIYWTSYYTGIANVMQYNVVTDRVSQVTNVLTGVFQPILSEDGSEMFVRHFSTMGDSIVKFPTSHVHHPQYAAYRAHPTEDDQDEIKIQSYTYNQIPRGSLPLTLLYENAGQAYKAEQAYKKSVASQVTSTTYDQVPKQTQQVPQEDPAEFEKNRRAGRSVDLGLPIPKTEEELAAEAKEAKKSKKKKKKKKEKKIEVAEEKNVPSFFKNALQGKPSDISIPVEHPEGNKKYSPLPMILIPRYIVPTVVTTENAALFGLTTGNFDPLNRHVWSATVNYRTDADFVGALGTYVYRRYNPIFYAGGIRYALDWGQLNGSQFYEKRWQTFAGASYGLGSHRFSLSYFYEDRDELTANVASSLLINMKPYAGVRFRYTFGEWKRYANSVSQENGFLFKVGADYTDKLLGADDVNEEIVVTGDARFFLEMPWFDHHVLAIRVAGGYKWGDLQQFGVFRLGGPFGEGIGAAVISNKVFSMRGLPGITFAGDRAFIAQAEYRIPLVTNANLGAGTMPLFLNKLHLALFVDSGDIEGEQESFDLFERYMVAPGVELKSDIVFGYGLPMTLRLGYGVVLVNSDRIAGLEDTLLNTDLKKGTVYLQVGTAF